MSANPLAPNKEEEKTGSDVKRSISGGGGFPMSTANFNNPLASMNNPLASMNPLAAMAGTTTKPVATTNI